MLALALTNKKDFMNKFLKTEIFDHFLLQEGIVVSFAISERILCNFSFSSIFHAPSTHL